MPPEDLPALALRKPIVVCSELLDLLGIESCGVLGQCARGPYAPDYGLYDPARVNRVVLLDTGRPFAEVQDFHEIPEVMRRTLLIARLISEGLYLPFRVMGEYLPKTKDGPKAMVMFHYAANPADVTLLKSGRRWWVIRDLNS